MGNFEKNKIAVIIGAGPAGLTAAYELLEKTDVKPIIFEAEVGLGGISKTINYKGNLMDIGGHRFFSKSDRIMQWWQKIIPLGPDPEKTDKVMLLRQRISRIFFIKKFFDYPIKLNANTILNLGFFRMVAIGISYIKAKLFPIKPEKSLEDFFINRFGKKLFLTFFKDYTEKLWGVPCNKIKPEWGAQRIKGLSVGKVLMNIIKKSDETSLIQQFLYPKFGPGQLWSEVAKIIEQKGGKIFFQHKASGFISEKNKITGVKIKNDLTGEIKIQNADYFFSSIPVKELILNFNPAPPEQVSKVAGGLAYRDFITVGILAKKLKLNVPDNWIYIQERDVKLGRIQIFNNWSPYMVKSLSNIWLGLEYFCTEGDDLWKKSEEEFMNFAIDELVKINILEKKDVLDKTMVKVKKAYPAYFGSYDDFFIIREFTDKFENLFLIGRNGMHRYNNQDHSMLSAMAAVENIISGSKLKDNIWNVNAEKDYHESK